MDATGLIVLIVIEIVRAAVKLVVEDVHRFIRDESPGWWARFWEWLSRWKAAVV